MLTMIAILAAVGDESRFFKREEVDFWGTRRRAEAPRAEELWADSTAPAPVKRLLENPTRENAQAYLTWQKDRMDRLRTAMAALEAVQREEAPMQILYFSKPDCPWCAKQEKELEGLRVERVPEGSPLWQHHTVTLTPTLVVGARKFQGFTPREAILGELRHE